MNISKETKARLIDLISADISKHQTEINRLKRDLTSLQNSNGTLFTSSIDSQSIGRKTFKTIILGLLADGNPRTSRELLNHYMKEKGKNISMPAFSSQLSPMVHKDKKIKMHKEPNNSIETRTYYGLTEWFSGEKLKQEYQSKIGVTKSA